MTGDSFHAFVADPSLLDKDSALLLKELNSRYPFFRASQLLLAKNLRDLQHIDQRRQLHLAAVYAADRTLLQALLDGRHPIVSRPTEPSKVDAAPVVEDAPLPPAPAESQPIPSTGKGTENEVIESVTMIEVEKTISHPAPITVNSAPLETDESGLSSESEEKPVAAHQDIDLILEPVLYRVEDLLKREPVSMGEQEQPSTAVEEPEPDALPFDQWLNRFSGPRPDSGNQQSFPGKRDLASLNSNPTSPVPRPSSQKERPDLKDNIALIEDFLSALPKEGQGKRAEFFKPSRAAERSNTPDPEAVSETLANIYMNQGQFGSAAQAFDALAKRFPEKSSYFAARKMEAVQKSSDQ